MRHWRVDPKVLCRKHLLGAHLETHMLAGAINKGKNLQKYYDKHLVDPSSNRAEHDAIAAEMEHRSYKHSSPLPEHPATIVVAIDSAANLEVLRAKCPACTERMKSA